MTNSNFSLYGGKKIPYGLMNLFFLFLLLDTLLSSAITIAWFVEIGTTT